MLVSLKFLDSGSLLWIPRDLRGSYPNHERNPLIKAALSLVFLVFVSSLTQIRSLRRVRHSLVMNRILSSILNFDGSKVYTFIKWFYIIANVSDRLGALFAVPKENNTVAHNLLHSQIVYYNYDV